MKLGPSVGITPAERFRTVVGALLVFVLFITCAGDILLREKQGALSSAPSRNVEQWQEIITFFARSDKVSRFSQANSLWRTQLTDTISKTVPQLTTADVVLVPFSGADIFSGIALSPNASEHFLFSENAAMPDAAWAAWRQHPANSAKWCGWCRNTTEIASLREHTGSILESSLGGAYQLGHRIQGFAAQHGMLPLLLTAVSAADNALELLDVSPFSSSSSSSSLPLRGLRFLCKRRSHGGGELRISYVEASLHSNHTLAALQALLPAWTLPHSRVLTVVKAAEAGLTYRSTPPRALPGLSAARVAAITAEEALHNAHVRQLAKIFLPRSDFLLQDSTGFPPAQLRAFAAAGSVETVGAFEDRSKSARGGEYAALFAGTAGTRHHHAAALPEFGYCARTVADNARGAGPQSNLNCHLIVACRRPCQPAAER